MPWQVQLLPDSMIVESTFSGYVSAADLQAAAQTALALAHEHTLKLHLGDCSALLGGHSVFDLYAIVDILAANGFAHDAKEAVLLPQQSANAAEDVVFWENCTNNRGFNIRTFTCRDAALRWLTDAR